MPDDAQKFHFTFLGIENGRHSFRAPTWSTSCRKGIDAVAFENAVFEWLMENVGNGKWHMANGNAPGKPEVPSAFKNGAALCLLLSDLADVIRFGETFAVTDLNPRTLLEAAA